MWFGYALDYSFTSSWNCSLFTSLSFAHLLFCSYSLCAYSSWTTVSSIAYEFSIENWYHRNIGCAQCCCHSVRPACLLWDWRLFSFFFHFAFSWCVFAIWWLLLFCVISCAHAHSRKPISTWKAQRKIFHALTLVNLCGKGWTGSLELQADGFYHIVRLLLEKLLKAR